MKFACMTMVGMMAAGGVVSAHSGPPYPIVSNVTAGAYLLSLWADPDATDDGSAGGRFWVMVDPAERGKMLSPDMRVTVAVWPLGSHESVRMGTTEMVAQDLSRQYVALVMDHEGRYGVRVSVNGPLGAAEVNAEVDATYDLRPSPIVLGVSLTPFLLVGFLWWKVLQRRRQRS
jgi:hypothetical protein